jgi:Flp pilus assembly protein TadG
LLTATPDVEGLLAVIRLSLISSTKTRDRLVVRAGSVGTSALRELVCDCSGAVALEFLIIAGPLVLLFLGTFDIGLLTLTETRINFAVEAAAKCGAISAAMCTSPSETAAYGASIAGVPGLDASRFLVTTAACGTNVTATYPYSGVVLPALTLSAGACYPTERRRRAA